MRRPIAYMLKCAALTGLATAAGISPLEAAPTEHEYRIVTRIFPPGIEYYPETSQD